MEIGSKIRSLRLTHDMTLEDLANRTELTKGFLSQLERDLTSPPSQRWWISWRRWVRT